MGDLRTFLMRWQFWALEFQFLLVVVLTLAECRRLAIRRSTLAGAVLLAACAWGLVSHLPPRTNRIFFDEQIYEGIGRNMSDLHVAQMCNEGNVEYGRLQCLRGEYNKEPYGYPYMLSLIYRTTGVSDTAAMRFNNVVSALTVAVVVLLTALLFDDTAAALLAGLAFMVMPMQLSWSNTAAAEPSAMFACAATMLAAVHLARARTTSALLWLAALAGFAVSFRPECFLVVPLAGLTVLVLAPGEMARARFWLAAVAGAAVAWAPIAHLAAVRNEGWGASGGRMAWRFAVSNFPTNTWFYLGDERFPILLTCAALAGVILNRRSRETIVLLAYFLAFWAIFVFFYAGSYNYGADVRYSLMSYVPVAVFAGVGLGHLAHGLTRVRPSSFHGSRAAVAVGAGVVVQFLWYAPLVRATGEEAWAARADVRYAKAFAAELPPNSLVLTHNPNMFHVWGISAAQTSIAASERQYVEQQLLPRYAGGVYLHWNFWCNVNDPLQVSFCEKTLAQYPHDLIDLRRERNYTYALYRLHK